MDHQHMRRKRSVSEPTEFFESGKGKKGGGFATLLQKLPFLSGRLHENSRHHTDRSSPSDDEFCDLEEEMKKAAKEARSHKKGHKPVHRKEPDKQEFDITGAGDAGTYKLLQSSDDDHGTAVSATEKSDPCGRGVDADTDRNAGNEKSVEGHVDAGKLLNGDIVDSHSDKKVEKCTTEVSADIEEGSKDPDSEERSQDNMEKGTQEETAIKDTSDNEENNGSENEEPEEEEPPHHEPPPTPLPPPSRSCLKQRSSFEERPSMPVRRPMRKRSLSVPEGDPMIIFRLNRHVHFSPGTYDPVPRNCRYRVWIERHCTNKDVSSSINIKHEKRMQKLKQIHALDINKYLSKNHQNYHSVLMSPMRSLGCDVFM